MTGRASNRWKAFALLFPIVGMAAAAAFAQGPGSQRAFFQAWWGVVANAGYFPTPGLVAYYSMQNSGTNVIEEYNNLTGGAGSAVIFGDAYGIIEQGADFDATANASILLPYSTLLKPGTGDMSWSFLVNFNSAASLPDVINDINLGSAGTETGFGIGHLGGGGNGVIIFFASDGLGNYSSYLNFSGKTLNQWHHFVGIWDGSADTWEIWRDGTNVTATYTVTLSGTVGDVSSPNAVLISGRPNTTGRRLDGQMDEVLIYNRKLTSNEVLQIFGAYEL